MGEYKPVVIGVSVLIIFSLFLSSLVSGLNLDAPNEDSGISGFITDIHNFDLFGLKVGNIIMPDFVYNYLYDSAVGYDYIPAVISIPLMIILLTGIFYGLIKALPTT